MMHFKQKLALALGTLLLCVAPVQAALAADAATDGLAFTVKYVDGRYAVAMRPSVTPTDLNLTLTAQVTLKVPHGVGSARFEATDLQDAVADAAWTVTSRVDAPAEDPSADYVSFTVNFPTGNNQAYTWQAGTEQAIFSFANTGTCLGAVNLLENSDSFMAAVNSAHTNPGNQIDVMGLPDGNRYLGAYDVGQTSCGPEAQSPALRLFFPYVGR